MIFIVLATVFLLTELKWGDWRNWSKMDTLRRVKVPIGTI